MEEQDTIVDKEPTFESGFLTDAHWTDEELHKFNKKYNSPFGKLYTSENDNLIVSQNIFLSPNDRKTRSNGNIFVIGGAGSGKTDCVILPNLMRALGSYVVADPEGRLYDVSYKKLEECGYDIKVLNVADPNISNKYNPLLYIRDQETIIDFVQCFIANTTPKESSDTCHARGEVTLFQAIIAYLIYHQNKQKRTLVNALKIVLWAIENYEQFEILFEEIRSQDSDDTAVRLFDQFKELPLETRVVICRMLTERLKAFCGDAETDITNDDTIQLHEIGNRKIIIFLTGFRAAAKQKALVPILCAQAFHAYSYHMFYEGANYCPPYHAFFFLDNLPELGTIPWLDFRIATYTKYGISVIMSTNSMKELERIYDESISTILRVSAAIVLLGGEKLLIHSQFTDEILMKRLLCKGPARSANVRPSLQTCLMVESSLHALETMNDNCLVLVHNMPAIMDKKYQAKVVSDCQINE